MRKLPLIYVLIFSVLLLFPSESYPITKEISVILDQGATNATLSGTRMRLVDANGKQYTRKRVLKPVFKSTTKPWSLDEAKKRFKEQDAARKVRFDALPKKEVVVTSLKVKSNTEPKKDVKNFRLIVRRESAEKAGTYYDFATIPFKGTLVAAEVRAQDLFAKYETDTSFEAVVIKENDDVKKVLNRKNQTLSNAA